MRVNGYTLFTDILKGTKTYAYIPTNTLNHRIEEVSCQDQITNTLLPRFPLFMRMEKHIQEQDRAFLDPSLSLGAIWSNLPYARLSLRMYVSAVTLGCDVDSGYAALISFLASFMYMYSIYD